MMNEELHGSEPGLRQVDRGYTITRGTMTLVKFRRSFQLVDGRWVRRDDALA